LLIQHVRLVDVSSAWDVSHVADVDNFEYGDDGDGDGDVGNVDGGDVCDVVDDVD
jgi:hypothetical protein